MVVTLGFPLIIAIFTAQLIKPHSSDSLSILVVGIFIPMVVAYFLGAQYYKPKADKWEEEIRAGAHRVTYVRVSCPICLKEITVCPVCKHYIEPIHQCPVCKKAIVACSDCRKEYNHILADAKLIELERKAL